jgi:RNA polymerase sigma-70 factor, ECF subfamily
MQGSVTSRQFVTLPMGMRTNYADAVQRNILEESSTDGELALRVIAAIPGRDGEAEEQLYCRLAPRVRLYGLKHLRDAQAAADLVQDVLMLTLDSLRRGKVREPHRIASFVLGTCRQTIIDQRRGRERRQRILDVYAEDVPQADFSASVPLDAEGLSRCMERLSERERTVVIMTFYDGSSADQVAADLGISAANVRVIRHRALLRLRACMDGTGVNP